MIRISCSQFEKDIIIGALNDHNICPVITEDDEFCLHDNMDCNKCLEEKIIWDIK